MKIKSRKRGLAVSAMAESLFALWASGGERCEDLQQLRGDAALAALLRYELPAPNKEGPVARRYLAIRIKKKQGVLFADGGDRKHFAVVTNLDWDGDKILEWQRKKPGRLNMSTT
ncbi:MAG: hypothetical protein HZA03_04270 [Nitrospinae bacterium]|nr:hypothetical protein [Nitrospinota bacterium]